jgi:hypothetical protein
MSIGGSVVGAASVGFCMGLDSAQIRTVGNPFQEWRGGEGVTAAFRINFERLRLIALQTVI